MQIVIIDTLTGEEVIYNDKYLDNIVIIDTLTGEEVIYNDEYLDNDEDSWPPFIWTEGNYSCDCNRALFFARAKGIQEPDDPPCGDHRYRIKISHPTFVDYDETLH